MNAEKPFFYDVTLRDGNQALKKPWNLKQKEIIFNKLIELGVQGIEVGFAGASDMDFAACEYLAKIAPQDVVISGLARAIEYDIKKVYEAVKYAKKPRVHTFIALSEFNMKYVLQKEPEEVQKTAVNAVKFARSLFGKDADVQFSAEHFGDCESNIDFVIETFLAVIEAGANVINLPNTVERSRPGKFLNLVKKVAEKIQDKAIISVHCHNDLGMATATTVESYFLGARQLECSLNGLGERAGNTNIYEVAIALYNSGVEVPLNLKKIYETAVLVSEMAEIPIYEKMPLIGDDALAHRSGIHQDGAAKTKGMKKGAYRPIQPELIGREGEFIGFTSQSGKTAIYEIINNAGYPISMEEAQYLQPIMKKIAEERGELTESEMLDVYFKELIYIKGPYRLVKFEDIDVANEIEKYYIVIEYNGKIIEGIGEGKGPIEAIVYMIRRTLEQNIKLLHYKQIALNDNELGSKAKAMTIIQLTDLDKDLKIICRSLHDDTRKANLYAIINGLNLLEKLKDQKK
ncbi:MAG TPA: alpha-isopropylmalate synthase regulatory domain-containing protein [bacterium]|nr:alpha-isopropylmalate synthase regulatory domain-containing protein [bacterium]